MKTIIASLLCSALLFGCSREAGSPGAASGPGETGAPAATPPQAAKTTLVEVPSPAGAGGAYPFLHPVSDGVIASWVEPAGEGRSAVRFAHHREGAWTPATTIAEGDSLFVNWADFPSVVEDRSGVLFAHWLQKSGADTYAYDVMMSSSKDGGRTWRSPFRLNRDGTKTEHGFVTLAPLPDGGIGATWLDGRNMKAGAHEDAGDMTLRYAAVSADGELSSEASLDERTCECCTTAMAMTAGGPAVFYRDRSADEIRDISLVRHVNGAWTDPAPLHRDGWKINGCPVNGPQADARGNRVAVAWFTAADEAQRSLVAFSSDGGATFGTPVAVDDGKPAGRVDVVLLDDSSALVSWLEQTGEGAEIRARRVSVSGERGPSILIAPSSTARGTGFTRLARSPGAVWFGWTEEGKDGRRLRISRLAM